MIYSIDEDNRATTTFHMSDAIPSPSTNLNIHLQQ